MEPFLIKYFTIELCMNAELKQNCRYMNTELRQNM